MLSGQQASPCIAGDETDVSLSIHHRKLNPLPALGDLAPKRQQEALHAPDFHRVCVVRNPYARLVSAWADKIRQIEPGFRATCDAALRHAGRDRPDGAPTFREFVTWMIDTNDPLTCDAHWQPQSNLLYPDLIAYNTVIRIESFREDLLNLLETLVPGGGADLLGRGGGLAHNVALPVRWSETYDEELAARVAEFYAPCFEAYGYERESWRELVRRSDPDPAAFERAAIETIRMRNRVIETWATSASDRRRALRLV